MKVKRALKKMRKQEECKDKEAEPMFGPQPDVPGKCNAQLHIADDFGDNTATMKCQLEPGHEGRHVEVWKSGRAKVEWEGNDADGWDSEDTDD